MVDERRIPDAEVAELMEATYLTQRKDTVDRKRPIKDLLRFWPQLEIRKKSQVSDKRRESRKRMEVIIAAAENGSKNLRKETLKLIAQFQLLPLYFLEDEKEILRPVPVSAL